jgi:hypothetical protein
VVRVPVEITLYLLYQHHLVPASMTFEGRNFDILSGLTAPFIYYLAARRTNFSRPVLIIWNIAALALLLNIVATAILAFPSPLQTIAFDQPNRAITFFPYVWLPSFVVPAVLYAHLAALRILFAQTPGTAAH